MTPSTASTTPRSSRRRSAEPEPARGGDQPSSVSLTGRGGIVVVLVFTSVGALLADWFDVPMVAGGMFAAGCVLASIGTRRADLLTLVVSPPLVFFAVTCVVELTNAIAGDGGLAKNLGVGLPAALAAGAPWLFGGTALLVAITFARGLMSNVRELRERLAGGRLLAEEDAVDPVRWDEPPSRRTR